MFSTVPENLDVLVGDLIIMKFFSILTAQHLVYYLNSVSLDQNAHDSVNLCLLILCAF